MNDSRSKGSPNLPLSTIATILKQAANNLIFISSSPALDAEILLAHVLNQSRSYLYAHSDKIPTNAEIQNFRKLLQQRQQGKPIAYILGKKEFWSLELDIDENVLIPRPETELLVELCLAKLDKSKNQNILDLGTGSGAIALAIAHEQPNWNIVAIDKNAEALKIAKRNAEKFKIKNVTFLCNNWYAALPESQKFNAILSNPPYIKTKDPHLQKGDVKQEPISALTSGTTGLDDLTIIITRAKNYLENDGCIMVEHGYNQANQVQQLMLHNGFTDIQTYKDIAGHDRVTIGERCEKG